MRMKGGQEYSFRGPVAVEGRGAARALVREVDGLEGWRGGGAGEGGWLVEGRGKEVGCRDVKGGWWASRRDECLGCE